jgi:hypothetical protein
MNHLKKLDIVGTVLLAPWRNPRDIWSTRIFPVKVNTIQPVRYDKVNNISGKCLTVSVCHSFMENRI